ncbi:MAG: hypothetical protein WCC87_09375 [Candidatus Korobacteraceae bacterium]
MPQSTPKTTIKIEFQYKGKDDARPVDMVQVEAIIFEAPDRMPATALIPAVGDTVSVTLTDEERHGAYKVLTRHFSYLEGASGLYVLVNIVVTDVEPGEMARRLKE